MTTTIQTQIGLNEMIFETGKLAKQADGAVTVRYGDTVVLVTAVASAEPKEGQDFFPLTVDYREKSSAVGKFPGGYFKREGRPTEKEILTARMTDRPLRPLFPKGFFNDTQIIAILLSADGENDPDILVINGASAALTISDIPFGGPVGAVRVGLVGGQFIVNPTHPKIRESRLDLVYVGSEDKMMMIEGSAQEVDEETMFRAIEFAHENVRKIIAAQKELAARAGKPKRAVKLTVVDAELVKQARTFLADRIVPALMTPGKLAREAAVQALKNELTAHLSAQHPAINPLHITQCFEDVQEEAIRRQILDHGKRMDGRGAKEIRPIYGEVGVLPRPHGSAIFSRGETQALVLTTLGSQSDSQEMDAWTGGPPEKTFILHYNFPPFSVGETGRTGGPGRREIGHGALAERSILQVMPKKETDNWPYVVRVTAEITESNGSSSMATVCGATLSLMDAGVPLKAPVAGISIGLVSEPDGSRAELLTDIIGAEDGFGDMDFKVAGTRNGITGFQTDLKIVGLRHDLVKGAFLQAREARLQILDLMQGIIAAPRTSFSKYAPRIEVMKIDPEKIGKVIGPGGKVINKIVADTGVQIDIEDDGTINIFSNNGEAMARAKEMIEGITGEIEVGRIYRGTVVTVKEFGAFVEVLPGQDGLVHISELADRRVERTEDVVKVGDEIWVKCIGIDDKGRVKLSRKAAMAEKDAPVGAKNNVGEKPQQAPPPPPPKPEVKLPEGIQAGKVYRAKVIAIKDNGAYCQILPGVEGFCHISEMADFRVRRVEDIAQVGDDIWVKCLGLDDRGQVKLSRKAALAS